MTGLALWGCGPVPDIPVVVEGVEPEEARRVVQTDDPAYVVARNPEGNPLWSARTEGSRFLIEGEAGKAVLEGVRGELFREGKLASRFQAKTGQADQQRSELVLSGGVRVEAVIEGLWLTAERVLYDGNTGLLQAHGRVVVESETYTMGPFEELWATQDLRRVGTPDAFQSR